MRLPLLILSWLAVLASACAQQSDEVVYRLELGAGAGMGLGFTDLSGKASPAGTVLARFPLNPRMAIKAQVAYVGLRGNTTGLKPFYPANPEASGPDRLAYETSGAVYDVSGLYEIHFLPYGYERDYRGHFRLVPYLQMGFGLAYGTAGKAFTAQIPLGVGLKYKVAPRLNLGLDWQVHFSLSDKLDGLADPLGIKSTGFRNKDHYTTLSITLTYDLNPRCPTCNRDQ